MRASAGFQALTTALSATVGIGNIAGVALAIHVGGPGALFWMWITALLGMATKYGEVTLAQHYREILHEDRDARVWEGSVAGGPMYYIERGMREVFNLNWKGVAVFFIIAAAVMFYYMRTPAETRNEAHQDQMADPNPVP